MTLEKYGAILTELEAMENWYESELELAGKAGTSVMDYEEFVEDGLNRIAKRQGVEIEVVMKIYKQQEHKEDKL